MDKLFQILFNQKSVFLLSSPERSSINWNLLPPFVILGSIKGLINRVWHLYYKVLVTTLNQKKKKKNEIVQTSNALSIYYYTLLFSVIGWTYLNSVLFAMIYVQFQCFFLRQLSCRLQMLDEELCLYGCWLTLLISCNPLALHYVECVNYLIVSNLWLHISVAAV